MRRRRPCGLARGAGDSTAYRRGGRAPSAELSATLAPHDFGADSDEGEEEASPHEHALTLKIGRRTGAPIGVEGGPWARPVLAGFGYPVTFQEILVRGTLTEGFRGRLNELAKKGTLETLRARFDAEEAKAADEERKKQEREDRKRKGK